MVPIQSGTIGSLMTGTIVPTKYKKIELERDLRINSLRGLNFCQKGDNKAITGVRGLPNTASTMWITTEVNSTSQSPTDSQPSLSYLLGSSH
jgi:hypothetical protein